MKKLALIGLALLFTSGCAAVGISPGRSVCWKADGKDGEQFRTELAQCEMTALTHNQRDACLVSKGYRQQFCSN